MADSDAPSSAHAKDSAVPNSVHAYSLHRDAIKLKLYHLHATLMLANWLYDAVT
eukprot:jgi/Psemu1/30356/gm1.30356_g